ncbi:MAG: dicarboxylate/amino acid:cation symporter, partial [Planctomycetes bacterium]|nr:dicarboxylate/amino acid:cation symporter [Planctomycetota bacterium]
MGVEEITVSENNVPRSAEPSRSGKDGVWLIILSMILGVLVSGFFPSLRKNLASMGKLFMALLQMCALPMLVISVISAPRRLFGEGSQSSMRPGLVILMKYIVSMALSATVGLAMAVLLRPGSRLGSHALDFIDRSFAGVDGGAAPAAVGDADIMVFF